MSDLDIMDVDFVDLTAHDGVITKYFYKEYDGTAKVSEEDCTECGAPGPTMEYTAELNIGEHYVVNVCRHCLAKAIHEIWRCRGK